MEIAEAPQPGIAVSLQTNRLMKSPHFRSVVRLADFVGAALIFVGVVFGLLTATAIYETGNDSLLITAGVILAVYLIPGMVLRNSNGVLKEGNKSGSIAIFVVALWTVVAPATTAAGMIFILLNGHYLDTAIPQIIGALAMIVATSILLYHSLHLLRN